MYQKIKEMAEEALKLQNKDVMDETLNMIIAMCNAAMRPVSVKISTHVPGGEYEKYDDSKSVSAPMSEPPNLDHLCVNPEAPEADGFYNNEAEKGGAE